MERYIVGESANSNLRLSGPQRSVTGLMCSALSPPVETTGVGAGQGGDTCSRTGRRGREEEIGLARRRVGPGTLFVRRICRLEFGQGRKAAARMDGTDGGVGSRTTKTVQLTSVRHMYVPYVSLTRQSPSFPPTTHTQNTAPHSTWYTPPTHTSARCCQSEYVSHHTKLSDAHTDTEQQLKLYYRLQTTLRTSFYTGQIQGYTDMTRTPAMRRLRSIEEEVRGTSAWMVRTQGQAMSFMETTTTTRVRPTPRHPPRPAHTGHSASRKTRWQGRVYRSSSYPDGQH